MPYTGELPENRRESEPNPHESRALSPYGPHTTRHYRCPTQGNYRKTAGKVNQIPANPGHFPLWSTHYKALQVAYKGELPKNRRESEPNPRESRALSPYGPHTTRHYKWPTKGNYRKTTGKVNQIPANPGHFPPWDGTSPPPLGTFPRLHSSTKATLPTPNPAPQKKVKGYGIRKQRSSCLKDILNWNICKSCLRITSTSLVVSWAYPDFPTRGI